MNPLQARQVFGDRIDRLAPIDQAFVRLVHACRSLEYRAADLAYADEDEDDRPPPPREPIEYLEASLMEAVEHVYRFAFDLRQTVRNNARNNAK